MTFMAPEVHRGEERRLLPELNELMTGSNHLPEHFDEAKRERESVVPSTREMMMIGSNLFINKYLQLGENLVVFSLDLL